MIKKIIILTLGLISVGCTAEKEATVVDHKNRFYSREGAVRQIVAKPGDDAASIAKRYNVSSSDIIRINHLSSSSDVRAGMTILLPINARESNTSVSEQKTVGYKAMKNDAMGGKDSTMGYFYTKKTTVTNKTYENSVEEASDDSKQNHDVASIDKQSSDNKLPDLEPNNVDNSANQVKDSGVKSKSYKIASPLNLQNYEWPLQNGEVLSRYGNNGRKFNDGINIAAPAGTPVSAASEGKVAYIGNNVEGYGNLVIIKHDNNIMTAYAHLNEITVERGAQIKKGEVLGTVGKSGNASQPQLHFSVRKGKKTVNPEIG